MQGRLQYKFSKQPSHGWITDSFNKMPYRPLGNSGLWVSNIGLGTLPFGYPEKKDGSRVGEKGAHEIMDRAVELGVTFWDTANRYTHGTGNTERVIGSWFKRNPEQRRNIVLATKIFAQMDGMTPNHSRLSRGAVLDAVYACLERMNIDYIDLLYFHYFDPFTPVEESLSAIEDLVSRDIIRYFGVSNFTLDQLRQYKIAENTLSTRCKIVAVQNQFDILKGENKWQPGVLPQISDLGISFVPWSPLARGLLTEKYDSLKKAVKGDWRFDEGHLKGAFDNEIETKIKQLGALAFDSGMSINQLAIAYMLSLKGMGSIIASVTNLEQLKSNAKAGSMILSREQIEKIAKITTQGIEA